METANRLSTTHEIGQPGVSRGFSSDRRHDIEAVILVATKCILLKMNLETSSAHRVYYFLSICKKENFFSTTGAVKGAANGSSIFGANGTSVCVTVLLFARSLIVAPA